MFMREFKVIDSAPSVAQLKKRLKSEDYEKYGEPFTPEFVYDAIRTLPRFASMRVRAGTWRESSTTEALTIRSAAISKTPRSSSGSSSRASMTSVRR
jgi:hypothetical protein